MTRWNLIDLEQHEEDPMPTWPIVLAFAAVSIPFLTSYLERKQDCYPERAACEQDWNSTDCQPQTDPSCRYMGGTYRGGYGGHYYSFRGYGHGSNYQHGAISRGGFGKFGRAFSIGG